MLGALALEGHLCMILKATDTNSPVTKHLNSDVHNQEALVRHRILGVLGFKFTMGWSVPTESALEHCTLNL